ERGKARCKTSARTEIGKHVHSPLFELTKLFSLRQSKTENIASGGHRDVLHAVDRIGHRRRVKILAGLKMPQRNAGTGIDGFERLGIIAKEKQPAFGGHGSGGGMARADLQ